MYFRFCFAIVGPMARVSSAVLEQVVKFPMYPPGCATLFDFVIIYNGSKWCTRMTAMITCAMLPLVGGLQCAV